MFPDSRFIVVEFDMESPNFCKFTPYRLTTSRPSNHQPLRDNRSGTDPAIHVCSDPHHPGTDPGHHPGTDPGWDMHHPGTDPGWDNHPVRFWDRPRHSLSIDRSPGTSKSQNRRRESRHAIFDRVV
ncbi:MAG: hypothetical protein F9B45_27910 [Phycisphaera sp. RhM]|nr:hypothetical protein [Phycisphaera sp. RhM]